MSIHGIETLDTANAVTSMRRPCDDRYSLEQRAILSFDFAAYYLFHRQFLKIRVAEFRTRLQELTV